MSRYQSTEEVEQEHLRAMGPLLGPVYNSDCSSHKRGEWNMFRSQMVSLLWIAALVFLIGASGCSKATPTPTPTLTSTPTGEPMGTPTYEPPPLPSQAARHSIGSATAPVTVVDFSDFR